jgi:hypothetical protein
MTDTKPNTIFHVLKDGITIPRLIEQRRSHLDGDVPYVSVVARRGDEFKVSPAYRSVCVDRFGFAWTDDLSDEAQVAMWGEVRLAEGPTSEAIKAELADEAQDAAEADRLERLREARRYGRRFATEAV